MKFGPVTPTSVNNVEMYISDGCYQRDTVCDGSVATGCLQDDEWNTGIGFKCVKNGKKCRIPQQLLYDDIEDCQKGEDVCFDYHHGLKNK